MDASNFLFSSQIPFLPLTIYTTPLLSLSSTTSKQFTLNQLLLLVTEIGLNYNSNKSTNKMQQFHKFIT